MLEHLLKKRSVAATSGGLLAIALSIGTYVAGPSFIERITQKVDGYSESSPHIRDVKQVNRDIHIGLKGIKVPPESQEDWKGFIESAPKSAQYFYGGQKGHIASYWKCEGYADTQDGRRLPIYHLINMPQDMSGSAIRELVVWNRQVISHLFWDRSKNGYSEGLRAEVAAHILFTISTRWNPDGCANITVTDQESNTPQFGTPREGFLPTSTPWLIESNNSAYLHIATVKEGKLMAKLIAADGTSSVSTAQPADFYKR